MSLDALRDLLPAYAKDLSLNLSSLASETVLTDQQKWGTFVASAHAIGVPAVVKAIEAAADAAGLSPEAKTAAKAAEVNPVVEAAAGSACADGSCSVK